MKRFSFLTLAIAVLGLGMAMAQPHPEPAHMGDDFDLPGIQGEAFGEKLGLSAEQKDQIRKLTLETRKKNIEAEAKGKIARIELHELVAVDTPDQKKIDAKIAELSQLHEARLRSRIETMLAMKKVLTPEQREKMKELRPFEYRREHMGRFGRGGFDGPRGPREDRRPRDQQK